MNRSVLLFCLSFLALICFVLAPAGAALAQAGRIGVFEAVEIAPDAVVEVPIRVEDIEGLYAIDLEMTFDPQLLEAQDADPSAPGVQMGLGGFLDPGLLLFNSVDNESGEIRFVMSQVNPSEPKSGDGILLVVYFKGIKEGESPLTITNLQTSDQAGVEILTEKVESPISVYADAPAIAATSIPVVDPTSVIQLPTPGPSPTPTPLSTVTTAAEATATAVFAAPTATEKAAGPAAQNPGEPQQVASSAGAETTETTPREGFSLLEHWWIVALALLLVAGLGIYLLRTKLTHGG